MDEPVRPTTRKLNQQYVEDYFKWKGCELLDEYKDCLTNMKYRCSCGSEGYIDFGRFKIGQRCKSCGLKNRINKGKRLSFEYVSGFFEDHDCKLLEADYKNARTKMRYLCGCGNEAMICFDSFRAGSRCRQCGTKRSADKQRNKIGLPCTEPIEIQGWITDFLKDNGCEYVSGIYNNIHSEISYKCKCGNLVTKTFILLRKSYVCLRCSVAARSGENHYEWRKDRQKIEQEHVFRQKCYKMLKHILKKIGQVKSDKTHVLLGYTYNDLIEHITAHPNWTKVQNTRWHLDHIFPVVAFLRNNINDLKIINHLTNLRPVSEFENLSKNDKYDTEEFKQWLLKFQIAI